jgi:hypothetical protein
MVMLCALPKHVNPPLVYCGVTVTVATIGFEPLFVAVKEVIFPVPLAAKPIDAAEFIQV